MRWVILQVLYLAVSTILAERLSYLHISDVRREKRVTVTEVQPFPTSCPSGKMLLTGRYIVASSLQVNETCFVTTRADDVVEVQLMATLTFTTEVRLGGELTFTATEWKDGPCLHIAGDLLVSWGHVLVQGYRSSHSGPNGAVRVDGSVAIIGSLAFQNCHSKGNAGALSIGQSLRLQQSHSRLTFQNVTAMSAGAMHVNGDVDLLDGLVLVNDAHATGSSGAIRVEGKVQLQLRAMMRFSNCSATAFAGAASFAHGLVISNDAVMSFENCISSGPAGALELKGVLENAGQLTFENCRSQKSAGGGLYLMLKAKLLQSSGSMIFKNCTAGKEGAGGGLMASGRNVVQVSGGQMFFEDCVAKDGGGIKIKNHGKLVNNGGTINMTNCIARGSGGGASIIESEVRFDSGHWNFQHCSAGGRGGAVVMSGKLKKKFYAGTLQFTNSFAKKDAGGLKVEGGEMIVMAAKLNFTNCSSLSHGGGFHSDQPLKQEMGQIHFRNCSAQKGGGLYALEVRQGGGIMTFEDCKAEIQGGGLWSGHGGWSQDKGILRFKNCFAKETAGGAYSRVGANLSDVKFEECFADGTGSGLFLRGAGEVQKMEVIATRADFSVSNILVVNAPLKLHLVDCTHVEMCRFKATHVEAAKLRCKGGSGEEREADYVACQTCGAGLVQLFDGGTLCHACPKPWASCNATHFQIMEGFMVSPSNLSASFFCPNAKACPGGDMPRNATPMCAEGYVGDGCMRCNETTHASADTSVVSCVKCAADQLTQALHITFAILKDIVLFCVAVAGIRGAAHTKKHSGVFTNQFMSFAAVASSSVAAVTQTATFLKLKGEIQTALQATGVLADLGNGESGGGSGLAFECLVSYLGFQKTVWNAHIYSCIVPALLMGILAYLQDFWLAMVVTTNCFLPGLCADFGKYFVCFRVRREQDGGELHCNFMPPDVPAPILLTLMLLCFILSTVGWTKVAYSKAYPPPKHVLYLNNAYKPEYAAWETERLLRKMLLKLLCALVPPSLSPSLHMTGVSIILLASLGTYLVLAPYKVLLWNRSESILLTLALVMTCFSNCLISNELDWGHSEVTQRILLFTIAGLAGTVSMAMIVTIAIQMRNESRATT